MRELSLFTGAGGGLLGTKLLGWTTVGYVEWEDYCQRVIAQRIADGILDRAPIFGDIHAFVSEGYAASYHGMVDVVTAGFPCQPFSSAGQQKGEDDARNMWPQTAAVIRIIRPHVVLLENVPGLLSHRYFGTVLGDLAALGYDCQWRLLSAAEVGAPIVRDRLWIFACTRGAGEQIQKSIITKQRNARNNFKLISKANWIGEWLQEKRGTWSKVDGGQPLVVRADNGMDPKLDRLKAIGNGQVPQVVATVWRLFTEGE